MRGRLRHRESAYEVVHEWQRSRQMGQSGRRNEVSAELRSLRDPTATHPVCSPQPRGASIARSVPSGTLTQLVACTSAWRAKVDWPKKVPLTSEPSAAMAVPTALTESWRRRCVWPSSNVSTSSRKRAGESLKLTPKFLSTNVPHPAGCPSSQYPQLPQLAKLHRTRSPSFNPFTSPPTRCTTPAPSCPAMLGKSVGNAPLCSARSVWQRPQAVTCSVKCGSADAETARERLRTLMSTSFGAGAERVMGWRTKGALRLERTRASV